MTKLKLKKPSPPGSPLPSAGALVASHFCWKILCAHLSFPLSIQIPLWLACYSLGLLYITFICQLLPGGDGLFRVRYVFLQEQEMWSHVFVCRSPASDLLFSVLPLIVCCSAATSSSMQWVQSRCKTLGTDGDSWYMIMPSSEALQKALEGLCFWHVVLYPAYSLLWPEQVPNTLELPLLVLPYSR